MSDDQIIGWMIFLCGIALGYLIGHGRGQISGIRWCTKRLDEEQT